MKWRLSTFGTDSHTHKRIQSSCSHATADSVTSVFFLSFFSPPSSSFKIEWKSVVFLNGKSDKARCFFVNTNRQNQFSVKIDKIQISTHCFAYILPLISSHPVYIDLPSVRFFFIIAVCLFVCICLKKRANGFVCLRSCTWYKWAECWWGHATLHLKTFASSEGWEHIATFF